MHRSGVVFGALGLSNQQFLFQGNWEPICHYGLQLQVSDSDQATFH